MSLPLEKTTVKPTGISALLRAQQLLRTRLRDTEREWLSVSRVLTTELARADWLVHAHEQGYDLALLTAALECLKVTRSGSPVGKPADLAPYIQALANHGGFGGFVGGRRGDLTISWRGGAQRSEGEIDACIYLLTLVSAGRLDWPGEMPDLSDLNGRASVYTERDTERGDTERREVAAARAKEAGSG